MDSHGTRLINPIDIPFPEVTFNIAANYDGPRDGALAVVKNLRHYCAVSKMLQESGTRITEHWVLIGEVIEQSQSANRTHRRAALVVAEHASILSPITIIVIISLALGRSSAGLHTMTLGTIVLLVATPSLIFSYPDVDGCRSGNVGRHGRRCVACDAGLDLDGACVADVRG